MRAALFAVLAVGVVVAPAGAAVLPILHSDYRIGHYRLKTDGTLRSAVLAVGPPDARIRTGETCEVRWRTYGMRMTFGGSDPCGPNGRFTRAILVGRSWSTASRLGIGAPAAAVLEHHPRAFRHLRTEWWWLVRRAGGIGLEAKVHRGRVTAFRLTVPRQVEQ